MSDPASTETCACCGAAICPPNVGWQATDERRIVPAGEPFERIVGTIPVGGIFPRTGDVDLRVIHDQRFKTERLWLRRWAEHEWRQG